MVRQQEKEKREWKKFFLDELKEMNQRLEKCDDGDPEASDSESVNKNASSVIPMYKPCWDS